MKKFEVLLDSGAYTISKMKNSDGSKLNIDGYLEYVESNLDLISSYFNFDVIGNGKASYENWLYLRKKGIDPIPVYHVGTDSKFLEMYLKQTDYVAIGAIANMSTKQRIYGLDYVWKNYLKDLNVKVHGLGLTSIGIVRRYPWYSVDSSTVIQHSMFGKILLPKVRILDNGDLDFDYRFIFPYDVSVKRIHFRTNSKSYFSLSESVKKKYDELINELGFKIGEGSPRSSDSKYEALVDLTVENDEERDSLNSSFYERYRFNLLIWDRFSKSLDGVKIYQVANDLKRIKEIFEYSEVPRFLFSFAYGRILDRFRSYLLEVQ